MGGLSNAERLRLARQVCCLSQADLSRASGVSQPNIAAFERGKRPLSDGMLQRLLEAAGAKPSVVLRARRDQVLAAVERRGASNLRVFGSVARGSDTVDSDVDLLVKLAPGSTLFDLMDLSDDLEHVLGVRVDLITEGGLTDRHSSINTEALPV